MRTLAVVLTISVSVCVVAPSAWSQDSHTPDLKTEPTGSQFGLGAASFFLTLPYGFAKVVYAGFGGIVGGLAYALTAGNDKTAKTIWYTSLRGTYVITPEHLKGDRPVQFFGVPPDAAALSQEPASDSSPLSEPLK